MANRGNEFVLDELLCYLCNPLFQVPVLSFMENNCLIFDTSTEDSPEYRAVHEQYRQLVDALLDAFRADSGLSHDQIIQAMKDLNAKPELHKAFQEMFEQVLAMEDLACFVHLMINKNLELQKQALMLLTMLHGGLPSSLQEGGGGDRKVPSHPDNMNRTLFPSQQEEDEVLRAVLEQSKNEYEAQQRASKEEEEDLLAVLNISQVESQRLEEVLRMEQERLSKALKSSLIIEDSPDSSSPAPAKRSPPPAGLASMGPLPTLPKESAKPSPAKPAAAPAASAAASKQKSATSIPAGSKPSPLLATHDLAPLAGVQKPVSSRNAAADWLKAAHSEVKSSEAHSQAVYAAAASMAGMSEAEYEKRVHILKQHRDKLMEMKRLEREKQLLSAASIQPARPASACAARQALRQTEGASKPATPSADEKKLAMRKAIANRIKTEVMEERNF